MRRTWSWSSALGLPPALLIVTSLGGCGGGLLEASEETVVGAQTDINRLPAEANEEEFVRRKRPVPLPRLDGQVEVAAPAAI